MLVLWLASFLGCPLSELGHDDFDRRAVASERLAKAGVLGLPVAWAALNSGDPELAYRGRLAVNSNPLLLRLSVYGQTDLRPLWGHRPVADPVGRYDASQFEVFVHVATAMGLHDPELEQIDPRNLDGIVWIMYGRAKARDLGYDWKNRRNREVIQGILSGDDPPPSGK